VTATGQTTWRTGRVTPAEDVDDRWWSRQKAGADMTLAIDEPVLAPDV
jgi:hypothetical protein